MQTVLITGGAGFFGEILKKELLINGFFCVSVDLEKDSMEHPHLASIQGDIRNRKFLDDLACKYEFSAVFHLAAILAHAIKDHNFLWQCNVDGTRNIAEMAMRHGIPKIIYTSSNCLWGESFSRPVTEDDTPHPIEIYGHSKLESENILLGYQNSFNTVIFRCPTIVDPGRLGLLAILFEFIHEGRKVWVIDGGKNRYQFISARDLCGACIKALFHDQTDVFNVGSDNVPSFAEAYQYVIDKAGTGSRLVSVPSSIAIPSLKLAHALGFSPLGPYQYKMIGEDFVFDTRKIKECLNWHPLVTNSEMLYDAYAYYHDHVAVIQNITGVSAHRKSADMGVLRLLKWLS